MKYVRTLLDMKVVAGLILSCAAQLNAAEIPRCPEPDGVNVRLFPEQIPQPLMMALTDRYGPFSSPGQKFNSTDVITKNKSGLSNRRIIFVWELEARWVFATERGGIYDSNPVLVYDYDKKTSKATLVKEDTSAPPSSICDVASKWIKSP